MKRNRTLDKIITKRNTQYGAPMGRSNTHPPYYNIINVGNTQYLSTKPDNTEAKKIYDCFIPMSGGYDRGGAYWGLPDNMRVKYTKDLSYIEFYRPE